MCKCKLFTVNHFFCNECDKLYCLKHRHHDEHLEHFKGQKAGETCRLI